MGYNFRLRLLQLVCAILVICWGCQRSEHQRFCVDLFGYLQQIRSWVLFVRLKAILRSCKFLIFVSIRLLKAIQWQTQQQHPAPQQEQQQQQQQRQQIVAISTAATQQQLQGSIVIYPRRFPVMFVRWKTNKSKPGTTGACFWSIWNPRKTNTLT